MTKEELLTHVNKKCTLQSDRWEGEVFGSLMHFGGNIFKVEDSYFSVGQIEEARELSKEHLLIEIL